MKRIFTLMLLMLSFGIHIKSLAQVDLSAPAFAMAWSPDGTKIATGHGSKLAIWDAQTGAMTALQTILIGEIDKLKIYSLLWLPNNLDLLIGGSPEVPIAFVLVFDTQTNTVTTTMSNESSIRDMQLSSDNSLLAVASPQELGGFGDDAVIFWSMSNYTEISRINGEAIEGLSEIALSPDASMVAITSALGQEVQMRNVATGNLLTNPALQIESPNAVDWSSDGHYLAAAAGLESQNSIIIWDTSTWSISASISTYSGFTDIAWNPVYPLLAAQKFNEIIIFDLEGNAIKTVVGGYTFAWSPDGTQIATGDLTDYTKLNIYDVCTNEEANDEVMACPEPMDLAN